MCILIINSKIAICFEGYWIIKMIKFLERFAENFRFFVLRIFFRNQRWNFSKGLECPKRPGMFRKTGQNNNGRNVLQIENESFWRNCKLEGAFFSNAVKTVIFDWDAHVSIKRLCQSTRFFWYVPSVWESTSEGYGRTEAPRSSSAIG